MQTTLPFSLADLQGRFGEALEPASFVVHEGAALWLAREGGQRRLAVLARPEQAAELGLSGSSQPFEDGYQLMLCPCDHSNAAVLRRLLPWLQPRPLGLTTSAGFGDRLGNATPGHARALQRALEQAPGSTVLPIFAQQSIREMQRTGRSPEDVMADATWGVFQSGWRGGIGADADHLKTPEDIDRCVSAGFSFYTIDPGAYVDDQADEASAAEIERRVAALPWDALESSPEDLRRRYAGRRFELEDRAIGLDEAAALRAAVKYGRAVAHVAMMYRHLERHGVPFELEVSVDETESVTTHAEHIYIAGELRRLGVQWVSLAPRYVGRFEKGVDYIGDLEALTADLAGHAAIARALGPYKLSLHSGSDKFSVYPLAAAAAQGQVHLKTAGTSYLEALRVVAAYNPPLFRKIGAFALGRYAEDRASYHVSAEPQNIPALADQPDERLPDLLEHFDMRQVLHVTFGSALAEFGERLRATLDQNEEAYYATLERHFLRHLLPLVGVE